MLSRNDPTAVDSVSADRAPRYRRLAAFLVMALVATALAPLSLAAGASQNEVLITVLYDGTEVGTTGAYDTDPGGSATMTGSVPEPHTPGKDAGPQNGVIKTYDTYAMRVDWNVNEDAAQDVVLTVVLPAHSQWEPDDTGMISGCDPTLSSFPDPQTLICHLGDQPEGSNGTIRPVASIGFENDSETFNVTTTLTTADDATGVTDQLDQALTVSEAPLADWVKGAPTQYGPFTHAGVEGYLMVFPIALIDYSQNGAPMTGMGPINDTVPLDLFDHAWGFTDNTVAATAAHFTSAGVARNACGAFDDAASADFPITPGTWTCGAVTSPNGYPVIPLTVTGHATVPAPATMADGVTPNEAMERLFADGVKRTGAYVVTGQASFFLPKSEVDAEVASADNESVGAAAFYNSLAPQEASTNIDDEDDVAPDQIAGSTGTTPEYSVTNDPLNPNNNTRKAGFGVAVGGGSPGSTINHNIRFRPGPLQLLETARYGAPRVGPDLRSVAVGGMADLPGSHPSHQAYSYDGVPMLDRTGRTPRGAVLTIHGDVITNSSVDNSLWDAPISGCFAFDPAHYEITELPTSIPVTQVAGDQTWGNNNTVTGAYGTAPNAGPLAHVVTGEGHGSHAAWRGQHSALGGDAGPYAFTVEFTDAPVHYHSGSSFGVENDALTCDNADAGPSGWVDAEDFATLASAFDPDGDGNYQGVTKARVRITERFSWSRPAGAGTEQSKHGFHVFFNARVKSDIAVNNNNSELMALASHAFGDVDPATGASDFVPYIGASPTHCSPYSQRSWTRIPDPTPVTDPSAHNDIQTTTGWCNHAYRDDGVDSFDETDLVDWDNSSWTFATSRPGPDPRQFDGTYDASGTMVYIVGAELGLVKDNLDGLTDVKDNGELVQFRIRPSIVGSSLEALTDVRLEDPLPSNYQFVRVVQQPATGTGCAFSGGSINCQFSEPNPTVDSDPALPAGLAGGWEDELIIEVRVVGAIANPDYPTQITNTATIRSSGLGPWDETAGEFTGTIGAANKSRSNSAASYMPLPADQGAIVKAVDTLDGACDRHPTQDPMPAGWEGACSTIGHDENMSFVLSLTNEGNTQFTNIEIVDVFPHNADGTEPASGTNVQGGSPTTLGDGRTPGSDYDGTLGFVSVTPVANAAGVTTWVTGDDPTTISRDPAVTVGQGVNTWCDAPGGTVQSGAGSCPATPADVTATYSVVDGPLNPARTMQLRLTLDPEDSTCDDHWTNTFGARVDQILLPIRSNDVTVMVECEFDLALTKTIDPAFTPGADWITEGSTTVPFVIEVTNQGDPVEDFDITDYVDTNVWSFAPGDNPNGATTGTGTGAGLPFTWDPTDPAKPVASIDGRFDDGDTLQIPVVLTIEDIVAGAMVNTAEISYFDFDGDPSNGDSDPDNPNNPTSGPLTDEDSTPDDTDGGVDGEDPDGDMVDDDTSGDGTDGGDEDDHDSAIVPVYDLELIKVARDPGVDVTTTPWHATFDITVTNQGDGDVYLVDVIEYPPAGLTLDAAATSALWTAEGLTGITNSGSTFTIAGPIVGGTSVTFPVVFDIVDLTAAPYVNAAEIAAFDTDADPGNPADPFAQDVDSTPDTTNDYVDADGDGIDDDGDVIDHTDPNYDPDDDGDVHEATPGDEDDHDIAELALPIDLALQKRIDPTDPDLLDGVTQGDELTFFIEVFNQAGPVEDFHVTDYVSASWVFDPALNLPGTTTGDQMLPFTWDVTDPTAPVAMVDGALDTFESVVIPVVLVVDISDVADGLYNYAEISYFDDDGDPSNGDSDPDNPNNPASGPLADIDSEPDQDNDDPMTDDEVDENAVTGDTSGDGIVDEDDHDQAFTRWWDLELIKERSSTQPYVVDPSASPLQVSFDITVNNQGPEDAVNITVLDTPPAGLTFNSVTGAVFTDAADGAATVTSSAPNEMTISQLTAEGQVTFTVIYDLDLATAALPSVNTAEISGMEAEWDPDGPFGPLESGIYPVADIDSTPDTDPTNDAITADGTTDAADSHNTLDNDPDGDGNLHNADGQDEDDHDTEAFVLPWDLALAKTFVSADSPLVPNGTVTMHITVTNQGPAVENIDVVDYLDPAMWSAFEAGLNPDGPVDAASTVAAPFMVTWDATDPQNPIAQLAPVTAGDKLGFGETIVITITARIADPFDTSQPLVNGAEISRFDDDGDATNGDSDPDNPDNPASGPLTDVDSTPDDENGNGTGEGDDLVDDDIDGNGDGGDGNTTSGDEDDHDIVGIPIMDLAMRKSVDPSTVFPVVPGGDVTFLLEIINQGNTHVTNMSLIDYVDLAMWDAFDAADNPAGTTGGDAALTYTWAANANGQDGDVSITGVLAPGETVTVPVTLTIALSADLETLSNSAEIAGSTASDADGTEITNPDGSTVVDVDSTADDTNDDPVTDDIVDGTDGDEDDHDVALVEPPTYSVGNQVWDDADNNGMVDPGEDPIEGVVVHLFGDADGDGQPDDLNNDGVIDENDAIATTTTDADGGYLFEDLPAGDYIIGIAPENFDEGGPLDDWVSSDPTSTDANDDIDDNDDGTPCGCADGYVYSSTVTLDDTEPTGETGLANDPNNPDVLSNTTVDFGFWKPTYDAALEKRLADGQSTNVTVGDDVDFTIEIFNQGNVALTDVEVIDYVPTGMTLNDSDWTDNGDGTATIIVAGPIDPGAAMTVDVTMTITAAGSLENHAEIAGSTPIGPDGEPLVEPDGSVIDDIDSTPDTDNTDVLSDGVTNSNADGGDEDDHDVASLTAVNPPAPPSAIAFTGRESNTGLGLGVALLWMGFLILAAERFARRRSS